MASWTIWLLLGIVSGAHVICLVRYGVDLPLADEWDELAISYPSALSAWTWIWTRHGDHLMAPTKAVYAAFIAFDALDLRVVMLFNFGLFVLQLVAFRAALMRSFPSIDSWFATALLIFPLGGRLWENHGWAFQSAFHFALLAFFVGVAILPAKPDKRTDLLVLAACAVTAISFAAGMILALVLAAGYALVGLRGPERRLTALLPLALALTCLVLQFAASAGRASVNMVGPLDTRFWKFLLTIVSSGFGVDIDSLGINPPLANSGVVGLFFLALLAVPVTIALLRGRASIGALVMSVALLGATASIATGRAAWWDAGADGKSPRYAEFVIFLTPLCIAWYWQVFTRRLAFAVAAAILVLFVVNRDYRGIHNNWDFTRVYREYFAPRAAARACVHGYYAGENDGACLEQFIGCRPEKCRSYLEGARAARMSFAMRR